MFVPSSRHGLGPQFHQDNTIGTKLRDLLTDIAARASAVGRERIGHPDIALPIDMYAVGEGEHARAEAPQEFSIPHHSGGWVRDPSQRKCWNHSDR